MFTVKFASLGLAEFWKTEALETVFKVPIPGVLVLPVRYRHWVVINCLSMMYLWHLALSLTSAEWSTNASNIYCCFSLSQRKILIPVSPKWISPLSSASRSEENKTTTKTPKELSLTDFQNREKRQNYIYKLRHQSRE